MESQKGTIWPIPEEEEGACGLTETNGNVPLSQWNTSAGTWNEIHVDEPSTKSPNEDDKRESTVQAKRGARLFIARRAYHEEGHGTLESKTWSPPPTTGAVPKTQRAVNKSWAAPGGYTAYFSTVTKHMRENDSEQTPPCFNQHGNNSKKQINKTPGSLPYARGNNQRYWYGRQQVGTPTRIEETANNTRRYGRGGYHNAAKPSAQQPVEQRGNQKKILSSSTRTCSRGAGNSCLRGVRRPLVRRGAQTSRQTSQEGRPSSLGDHVPPAGSGTIPTSMTAGLGIPHGMRNPNSPFITADSPAEYLRVQVHAHQSSPHYPDEEQGRQWGSDIPFSGPQNIRPPCLCPQLRAAEAMGYVWRAEDRPVMPVMVPQNPPVGTPVYYQQPMMGAAWSPYVPLVETYNEMPCYPTEYGNSGYYSSSYGNPVYQNNPMEYMAPNPAGDVQNNTVADGAMPPQSEVQQPGESQNRPPVCSQCGGCGSCGHCTCSLRPRTSTPLLNQGADPQPSTSRTVAEERPGPINFGAQKSVKDDGSDLPKDIATLRYFFNLGVDAHRSATRCVPNGNSRSVQVPEEVTPAEQEIGDEISSLVGRLHRVVFRQCPEPKVLEKFDCGEQPNNGSVMTSKKDSTTMECVMDGELPKADSGVDMTYERLENVINHGFQYNQVLHTARAPPAIREVPSSDEFDDGRREEELHIELFPPLPKPGGVCGRRGGRGLHDHARFPLNQRNADQARLPPIYYVTPGKYPWSQNQKDGNMGRGIDTMRGNGRLRTRRNSDDCSGGMSTRPVDSSEQNSVSKLEKMNEAAGFFSWTDDDE